jgi:hypothetical protein
MLSIVSLVFRKIESYPFGSSIKCVDYLLDSVYENLTQISEIFTSSNPAERSKR